MNEITQHSFELVSSVWKANLSENFIWFHRFPIWRHCRPGGSLWFKCLLVATFTCLNIKRILSVGLRNSMHSHLKHPCIFSNVHLKCVFILNLCLSNILLWKKKYDYPNLVQHEIKTNKGGIQWKIINIIYWLSTPDFGHISNLIAHIFIYYIKGAKKK